MCVLRLMEVLDKGKAAAVTSIVETKDKASDKVIFENQSTVFIRGAGGFGGKRVGKGECQDFPPYPANEGQLACDACSTYSRSWCCVRSK